MATTVSAVESKSIVYNLVRTVKVNDNGEVTLKATFPNVPLVNGQYVDIIVAGLGNEISVVDKNGVTQKVNGNQSKITISGQYIDTNKAINPIVVCRNLWSSDISYANKYLLGTDMGGGWNDTSATGGQMNNWLANTIRVPVKEINDGTPAFIGGDATASPELQASAVVTSATIAGASVTGANLTAMIPNQNRTAASADLDDGPNTLTYDAGTTPAGAKYETTADNTAATPTWTTESGADVIAKIDAYAKSQGWDKLTGGEQFTIQGTDIGDATAKLGYRYTAPTAGKTAGWYKGSKLVNLSNMGIAISGTAQAGDNIVLQVAKYQPAKGAVMANITVTATVTGLPDLGDVWDALITKYVSDGTLGISLKNDSTNDASVAVKGDCTMSNYKRADKVEQYPMMTDLSGISNVKIPGTDAYYDIMGYLANTNVNGDKGYRNVQAVINDAVENYDSVVFKFNTAAQKVDEKTGKYDDNGTDKYMKFGQHLYNGWYDPELFIWLLQ